MHLKHTADNSTRNSGPLRYTKQDLKRCQLRRKFSAVLVLVTVSLVFGMLMLSGCGTTQQVIPPQPSQLPQPLKQSDTSLVSNQGDNSEDSLFQTSTIDALLEGIYDGELSLQKLLEHGNFGIGTFQGLEGEMIVLDNQVFQVKADGNLYRPNRSMLTPFAAVCQFSPEAAFTLTSSSESALDSVSGIDLDSDSDSGIDLESDSGLDSSIDLDSDSGLDLGLDYTALKTILDDAAPNQNLFYAFRIDGNFRYVKTRSVPKQQKPYPPLHEITKSQPEFTRNHISGSIIGFRSPVFVEGINVPGYHLHFLSDDASFGGHLLAFTLIEGTCMVDELNFFRLHLLQSEAFAALDHSQNRSRELEKVEQDQD